MKQHLKFNKMDQWNFQLNKMDLNGNAQIFLDPPVVDLF